MKYCKRLPAIAVIVVFAVIPARADDKADAAKMQAEWVAIPDGTVAPAVADALAFESQSSFAPKPQEVVYEMPAQAPPDVNGHFDWVERATLTQMQPNIFKMVSLPCSYQSLGFFCDVTDVAIFDRTGLITLYNRFDPIGVRGGTDHLSKIKVSALSATSGLGGQGSSGLIFTAVDGAVGDFPVRRDTYDCQVSSQGGSSSATCKVSDVSLDVSRKIRSDHSTVSLSFIWNTAFNMYHPLDLYGDFTCFEEICDGSSHKVVDFRLPGGDWHSKAVSAALSPADKQKALSLFAAGFDSYKTGDFIGAVALLQKGLTLDPGNYQAYFTLAEVGRSIWTAAPPPAAWPAGFAFYNYRRVVDLAPDSPEGVRAQGRLDNGLQ